MDKKTIIIILLLLAVSIIIFLFYKAQGLNRTYKAEVLKGLDRTEASKIALLTEDDIKHLPEPVQKYLAYVGAIGKEKVHSLRVVCEGEMKLDPKKDWVRITFEQYNFFDKKLTRMFYMKANMFGLPVLGLHTYTDEQANMLIKLAGLVTVLDSRGPEMRIGDTTTLFNDMCLFAPATLIDERISWEPIDSLSAKATFENNGCKISAVLYFNEKGEMVDFVSDDRYYIPMDGSVKKAVWSTPFRDYIEKNGIKHPGYGEAVWKLPEGDYCYIRFTDIKEMEYNCKSFK